MADFSKRYDVLVIGGGNAALCAAISAAREGASVLVLEAAPEVLDAVVTLTRETMENAVKLSVPLVVETGVGPNWMEAK
jgi:succinate dehydrogenase/fumarate reductase flavoprotein subunit